MDLLPLKNAFGITNIYLNATLNKLHVPLYKGIYAANTIPPLSKLGKSFCIIVNTSISSQIGKHWIVIIMHHNKAKTIDSLLTLYSQMHPKMQTFLEKIKASHIRTYSIQPSNSANCGFYCLHAIIKFHLLLNNRTLQIRPFINSNSNINDEICISNLEKMIPKIKK